MWRYLRRRGPIPAWYRSGCRAARTVIPRHPCRVAAHRACAEEHRREKAAKRRRSAEDIAGFKTGLPLESNEGKNKVPKHGCPSVGQS